MNGLKKAQKAQNDYKKLTEPNPGYRGYLFKLAFEFPPTLADLYLAFFCVLCAFLRTFLFYFGVSELQP